MKQCPYCKKYLLDDEECYCDKTNPVEIKDDREIPTNIKVLLTAIIYPLIVMIISLIIGVVDFPVLSMIAVLLCILAGFCIFVSGVYILVVPLPIITYYRYGTCENKFPIWLRIICGILSFVLMFIAITIYFF